MSRPVVHFEIHGTDLAKLKTFYKTAFGWELNDVMPEYSLVAPTAPGIAGGLGQSQDGSSSVTVYVQVADPAAALAQIESLGGKTIMPPMAVPGGPLIAMFEDPQGNKVGLVKE